MLTASYRIVLKAPAGRPGWLAGVLLWALTLTATAAADPAEIARGEYLLRAAGCVSCHTDHKGGGEMLAGGRALTTPFGTYYSPNITPDRETGIGDWTDADFVKALRHGVAPDGSRYFPVFPYTTYTNMSEADARAIKAYLFSRPPVRAPNRDHDVSPPFGWRWTMWFWQWLFFEPGEFTADPALTEAERRGAYLVEALSHCGECHTPRNAFGALDRSMWLAGTADGPDGELVANITPHPTGIADWSAGDIVQLMKTGLKPNFDDVQGSMQEAIEDGLKYLTDEDLRAIAAYLKKVPPIANVVKREQ